MTLLSPRLTKDENGYYDLLLENVEFAWATDGTAVAQHALVRIATFKGELSLGGNLTTKANIGTKYFEVIFSAETSRAEKELELKSRILGTPGVEKILSWDWEQAVHTATVTATVKTVYGVESVSVEVLPL